MLGMFLKWKNTKPERKYVGLILHVYQHFTAMYDISVSTRLALVFFSGKYKRLFFFLFVFNFSLEEFKTGYFHLKVLQQVCQGVRISYPVASQHLSAISVTLMFAVHNGVLRK